MLLYLWKMKLCMTKENVWNTNEKFSSKSRFYISMPPYMLLDFAATFYHHQLKCSISSKDSHKKVKEANAVCCNYIYAVKSLRRERHRFCVTIYFKHVSRPFSFPNFLVEREQFGVLCFVYGRVIQRIG